MNKNILERNMRGVQSIPNFKFVPRRTSGDGDRPKLQKAAQHAIFWDKILTFLGTTIESQQTKELSALA